MSTSISSRARWETRRAPGSQIESFVESFIRPQGLDRAATPVLVGRARAAGPARPRSGATAFSETPVARGAVVRGSGPDGSGARARERDPSSEEQAGPIHADTRRRCGGTPFLPALPAQLGNPVGRWLAALGTTCAGWLRAGRSHAPVPAAARPDRGVRGRDPCPACRGPGQGVCIREHAGRGRPRPLGEWNGGDKGG